MDGGRPRYIKAGNGCRQLVIARRVSITWLPGGRWHPVKLRFHQHTLRIAWRYEKEGR